MVALTTQTELLAPVHRCGRAIVFATVVLSMSLGALPEADAQPASELVEEARRLYLEADFREAADRFTLALERPSLTVEDASEAHRYLTALRLLLGDAGAASEHAEAALALDPTLAPPEGSSPEVVHVLDEARTRLGGRRAELAIERLRDGNSLRAELAPAPAALVSRIGLRCARGDTVAERESSPPRVTVQVAPAAGALSCRAWAATSSGAHLLTLRREILEPPQALPPEEPAALPAEGDEPAWPWIVLGGAVALAGAVAAVILYFALQPTEAIFEAPMAEGW